MIRQLRITGLGPHADTALTLDPGGLNELAKPSAWGKSTLTDAILFVLDGRDRHGDVVGAEHITTGADACEVEIEIKTGAIFGRRKTRGGTVSRWAVRDGARLTYSTDATFRERLGSALGDGEATRAIVDPSYLFTLATGTGGGRPLRDLIERILPGPTVDSVLAEQLREGEPRTEKDASAWRTAANKARNEAAGSVATLTTQHAEAVARADVPDRSAERAELASRIATLTDEQRRADAADALHREWRQRDDARRKALAAAPPAPVAPTVSRPDAETVAAAVARTAEAQRAVNGAADALVEAGNGAPSGDRVRALDEGTRALVRQIGDAERELAQAEGAAKRLDAVPCGGRVLMLDTSPPDDQHDLEPVDCSTCPLIADARTARDSLPIRAAAIESLREQLAADIAQHAELKVELDEQNAAHAEALTAARATVDAARSELRTAEAAQQELWRAAEAWRVYDEALTRTAPTVPDPGPEPVLLPSVQGEIDAAWSAIRSIDADTTRREAAAAEVARLAGKLAEAQAKEAAAIETAARAEAVLIAVRAAPGVALRAKLDALTELGPVAIEVPDDGDAIRLLIDGLGWQRASTGRRIVASVYLRDALRRAINRAWIPIVIDEAQSVAGCELPAPGVCLVLRTAEEVPDAS